MNRSTVFRILLILMLFGMLAKTLDIQLVEASETIYIRADGSINPPTAPISTIDNITYTFTGNIYDELIVERNDTVINGSGFSIQGTGSEIGIFLYRLNNVTIENVEIKEFSVGIHLTMSSNCTLAWNTIRLTNVYGICIDGSSNSTIIENNVKENSQYGIFIVSSSNNTITGNNATNNKYGIELYGSSNNTLSNNSVKNNQYNFGVYGGYLNFIGESNKAEDRPVYYWINEHDKNAPIDPGYLALVNCTRITVQNLNLTKNQQGILLVSTTNSTIAKNTVTNNEHGIFMAYSSNNSLSANNLTANHLTGIYVWGSSDNELKENEIDDNYWGIWLNQFSSNNKLFDNSVRNNYYGITVYGSSENVISRNNITSSIINSVGLEITDSSYNAFAANNIMNNGVGIFPSESYNNTFYRNNFIDNTIQIYQYYYEVADIWDNGFDGNYWSDYTGVDSDGDGIGDTPYVIDLDNQDNYPLMSPYLYADVNHDAVVNMRDIGLCCNAFSSYLGHPNWNPHCDINEDLVVNMRDIGITCNNFMKHFEY